MTTTPEQSATVARLVAEAEAAGRPVTAEPWFDGPSIMVAVVASPSATFCHAVKTDGTVSTCTAVTRPARRRRRRLAPRHPEGSGAAELERLLRF